MICSSGVVWLIDNTGAGSTGALNKFSSGTWSVARANDNSMVSVAIDPANGTHVYVGTNGGQLHISTNTGSTFVGPTTIVRSSTGAQPAWLQEYG